MCPKELVIGLEEPDLREMRCSKEPKTQHSGPRWVAGSKDRGIQIEV